MRTGRPGPATTSRTVRAGQVLTGLVALFLLFDGVVHLARPPQVVDSFRALGFPVGTAVGIGVGELVALALYLVPRTAVLGAILLTAHLGGAVAAQVRVEAPLVSTTLFPVWFAVALWAALWLRDGRIRDLLPLRRPTGDRPLGGAAAAHAVRPWAGAVRSPVDAGLRRAEADADPVAEQHARGR